MIHACVRERTRLVILLALAFESIIRMTANTKRTGQRLRDRETHILWGIAKMMPSYMRQIIYFRDLEGYHRPILYVTDNITCQSSCIKTVITQTI